MCRYFNEKMVGKTLFKNMASKTRKRALAFSSTQPSVVSLTPDFWKAMQAIKTAIVDLGSDYQAAAAEAQEDAERNKILLQRLMKTPTTEVSIQQLILHAKNPDLLISNARFLQDELPVRFAHGAKDLLSLPHGLAELEPIVNLARWYSDTATLLANEPEIHDESQWARRLASVLIQPRSAPRSVSAAIALWLQESPHAQDKARRGQINAALDHFFLSRVSLRFLMEHYIAARRPRPGFNGIFQTDCSPHEVAGFAAAEVARALGRHWGTAPQFQLYGEPGRTFSYVPSHLYYVLWELLLNAGKATLERHHGGGAGGRGAVPPVRVVVAHGREDVTIKVADEGGGFGRSRKRNVWSYLYSSRPHSAADAWEVEPGSGGARRGLPVERRAPYAAGGAEGRHEEELVARAGAGTAGAGDPAADDPLCARHRAPVGKGLQFITSHGMGLPLARLYAGYFGGALHLLPCEGYGTDAYVHLPRVGGGEVLCPAGRQHL